MTEQEAIERIFGAIEEADREFWRAGGASNYAAAKAVWNELKDIARDDRLERTLRHEVTAVVQNATPDKRVVEIAAVQRYTNDPQAFLGET